MPSRLLRLIDHDTKLTRVSSRDGGEYAGSCPFCRRGADRFHFWEGKQRWACLGPEAGRAGCGIGGDGIDYLRRRDGLSYADACAVLGVDPCASRHPAPAQPSPPDAARARLADAQPPAPQWQGHGRAFVARCQLHLWRREGRQALAYLHGRGLTDATISACGLGYQPANAREDPSLWGLAAAAGEEARPVWLPRGIVLPWFAGAQTSSALWRINIRRPITARQAAEGQPKYMGPRGCGNALYTPGLRSGEGAGEAAEKPQSQPVLLVEGEIDAMTAMQEAPDLVAAVATGSTAGGRRAPWLAQLAAAPLVLVAFDCDRNGAGDQAARWWLDALPNALRWRPLLHDVNAMHVRGLSVRQWIAGGIEHAEQVKQQNQRTRP